MLSAEVERNLDPVAFIDEHLVVAAARIAELIHRREQDVVELVCQCVMSDSQFVQHLGVGRNDVSQTLVLSEKAGVGAPPRPEECFDAELRYLLRVDVSLVVEDRIELWFGIMAVYSRNANACRARFEKRLPSICGPMSSRRSVSLQCTCVQRRVSGRSVRPRRSREMPRYLISFDDGAMDFIPEEEGPAVSEAAHAVIRDAQDAGVWVFAGGVYSHDDVGVRVVAPNGTVTDDVESKAYIAGVTIIDVPSLEEALQWAAKIAAACRCAQEVREFMPDPAVGN